MSNKALRASAIAIKQEILRASKQDLRRVKIIGRSDRAGYSIVEFPDGQTIEALNPSTPNVIGLQCYLAPNPSMGGDLCIIGAAPSQFAGDAMPYIVGEHASQHQFGAADVVWTYGNQFLPLLALPTGGFIIRLFGGIVFAGGSYGKVETQDLDLSSYVPATQARQVLIQADGAGAITLKQGTLYDSPSLLTVDTIPIPDAGKTPLWAISVYGGQTALAMSIASGEPNDFWDLRFSGYALGSASFDMAAAIHAASASAVTDSDEFGFWEDVSNGLRKITWANIKGTLKTYNDTLYQPIDATLTSLSALGTAADKLAYTTGVDTWAETGLTAFGRSILDDADEATFKATVNLEIGVDVQAYDATLAGISALADAAGVLLNDGAGNLSWAAGGGLPVADTTAVVKGSADATKRLRFEVDGFTTGTTRVLTPPNADITIAGQNFSNEFSATQKIYVYSGASKTVALSFHPNVAGSLPAYGIGMGATGSEGYVEYRSGTGTSNTFGHRFLVNDVTALTIGGTDIRPSKPLFINLSSTTALYASDLFYMDTVASRIGIGAAPLYQFDVTADTSSTRGLAISQHSGDVNGAPIRFIKSRGTKTAPSAVAVGDFIGVFTFGGYSGTQYLVNNAYFGGAVTGGVSSSSVPTSIVFVAGATAANYTPDVIIYDNHYVGIGPIGGTITTTLTAPSARLHVVETTGVTNAVCEVERIESRVSGAGGGNGFGVGKSFYAETATDGTTRQQALISSSWIDATDATRKADLKLYAYDTAARLGLTIEASGTAAKIGFFGATPVTQAAGIVDADGTLADITTRFNSLLGKLEAYGLLAVA